MNPLKVEAARSLLGFLAHIRETAIAAGLSPQCTGQIYAATETMRTEIRQAECPHEHTFVDIRTSGAREEVTRCRDCNKILKIQEV